MEERAALGLLNASIVSSTVSNCKLEAPFFERAPVTGDASLIIVREKEGEKGPFMRN